MKAWAKEFYEGQAWRQTRAAYLLSQHYICERCGDIAKVVHHRTYLTPQNINSPELTLSWNNLEALCQECHNKEHGVFQPADRRVLFDDDGNVIDVIDREPRRPPPGR